MALALALWDAVASAYGPYATAIVLLAIVLITGIAATVATAGFHYLRRVVRHRRVARELARVHEAAYRERFGRSGRLA